MSLQTKVVQNKYPQLKFELNLEFEVNVATQFFNMKDRGIDFGQGMVHMYPQL